jgi:hypothetical protein
MGTMRWLAVGWLSCFMISSLAHESCAIDDIHIIRAGGNHDWAPALGSFFHDSSTPIARASTLSDGFGTADVVAATNIGVVKASINGHFQPPFLQTRFFNPTVAATNSGSLVFQGPEPTISAHAFLHIEGEMTIDTLPPAPNAFSIALGGAYFEVTLHGVGSALQAIVTDDEHGTGAFIADGATLTGADALAAGSTLAISGIAKTRAVTVPTGVPVPASFHMQLNYGHLNNGFSGLSLFESDFANTMSWARGRPVFDLPPGYTVNGMGIVDNFYVIPEPASWMLLLMAGAGGYVRRGRAAF